MAAIESTAFFRLGPRRLNDDSLDSVLDEEVKRSYLALSDTVRQHVSLLSFSLQNRTSQSFLHNVSAQNMNLSPSMLENWRRDTADRCNDLRMIALNWLKSVPPDASSEKMDGYMAVCVQNNEILPTTRTRLDQWNYAKPSGRLEKSCESLAPSSLFSKTTVQANLVGKNVHFMMFDEGSTKIKCFRFDFGESQLDTDPNVLGDPTRIEKTFCDNLSLAEEVQKKLPIHAQRLEMAQNVLSQIDNVSESQTQDLFDHVLSMMLRHLEDANSNSNSLPIIDSVVGMKDMVVVVEVCAAYLRAQAEAKGQPTENIESSRMTLTIKSDLAVSMLPAASAQPENTESLEEVDKPSPEKEKLQRLLYCNYNIEMKIAHGELKHGGQQPKSQLLAESLARSIELRTAGTPRKVLFSMLSDCCSLYVLVHFPDSGNAYLSRREIEPGRMVAVIAWVHFMSTYALSDESKFSEESFVAKFSIGDLTFADEFQKQKRASGNMNVNKSAKSKRNKGSRKKAPEPRLDSAAAEQLIAEVEDEIVSQKRKLDHEAFVAYRNHYNFGWPLPPMERNLGVATSQQDNDSFRQERLARAGFVGTG